MELALIRLAISLLVAGLGMVAGAPLLEWNPNDPRDLDGYRVHFDLQPENMVELVETTTIDVGNVIEWPIPTTLDDGIYLVYLTAYDTWGLESRRSLPISLILPYGPGLPPEPPEWTIEPLTFRFSGQGGSILIEQSSDLKEWEPFTGKWSLEIEVEPTGENGFFRVRSSP